MITFATPFAFLLFIPLIFFFLRKRKKLTAQTLHFSHSELLQGVKPSFKTRLFLSLPYLRFIVLSLFIIALARPQKGHTTFEVKYQGVDIMIAIDTSRSMTALDFKVDHEPVNRLEIIKSVVKEFVKEREYDRIGLIVFGDNAYTQSPLTMDHNLLDSFIDKIKIGIAGDATAIGSALGLAVKRLKDLKSKSKIVILLTDGSNTAGQLMPLKAAELAKKLKVKVYTIGVGSKGDVPIPVQTPFGMRYVRQQVPMDEKTLQEIANITGGNYYRATDYEKLKGIYEEINKFEKSDVKIKEFHNFTDKYHLFLVSGLLLLLIELIISHLLRKI
ncbi:MAG: VWA domain-containing protein [Nitrospinae bacterium]|nr:VWA domain-containing protein [Nitrospinota bacterium]